MKTVYETIIGLEVHVELNTKTKMFCRCLADYFGKEPNTSTCPVCLGLPGALPMINEEAINKCIQIGLALNCKINPQSYFERKNYFYPDLSKGFQTSQLIKPVAVGGFLDVEDGQGIVTRIRINRAHQEEDTGKLTHQGGETLIDFNRSGVPLVEIVTEPDFNSSAQVRDYAKKLQQIFRYLGVSSADMERGDMRLEANVSVRPEGQKDLPPYRVELKNINSFRFMVAAVEYEIKRQIEELEQGRTLKQETRGWNEKKNETYLQRSKEEAHDYRYFPEPDLPAFYLEKTRVQGLESSLPELPHQKIKRYQEDLGLNKQSAQILAESKEFAQFFEEAVAYGKTKGIECKQIANFIINNKIDLFDTSANQLVDDLIVKKSDVLSDSFELEKLCQMVLDENVELVAKFKAGNSNIFMAIMGLVMRKSQGKANAELIKEILKKLLS